MTKFIKSIIGIILWIIAAPFVTVALILSCMAEAELNLFDDDF